MRVLVKAKPSSREYGIEKISENNFVVSVKEPPVRGQANEGIIRTLAEYFGVSRSQVRIVSGWTSRNKIIEIL
ncbi:MAG: hypothetical protein A3B91_02315 [Candidatus Yanofskybacteria bacterium RIFCSPHIGHO2_02_FULL_41_29]|uniref:UPF0235 protein A2650_01740 n=1 Tax=Candidatus Yanofskybacteria bacterium RIFCSPHIGHO2_01_FULL_41_53 TaxID=1802663 RepID=A0A1F8EKS2_9BACT|nr:MAG: hypothetical protein A2650_01740 [Candidatus Yanofskybacteria bacterium RIFCSPHIGHO2_01_FULL_41_53]OGN12359.1 MAG: hypothetical protein A3B91_02315 [Candidatus Yanofskybacteria bacterium RIFCSPHIGHO2_02_FULL_41_29]OGN17204.1 MAG: hypothetical protein A3F48_00195 [Candidatus Yanofskybacteria bacterium RIFCSPHIGHO2_12_FULL_41_9]OGN23225.1 MAG: hypothetical protein A2916_02730 [Candidatus Yanofskybacteria bacterium RIFCSPLOWO2_01_FULL_41_67]OGN28878.1 MAG: hypothetical protein A3H54_01910 